MLHRHRGRALATAMLVVAMLAPTAAATHLGAYAGNPVEHDDQGRSDEPDHAVTSVLGPSLVNKVVDLDNDGRAAPDGALPAPAPGQAAVLAPGCTDDSGRRPSGLCALWTNGFALWTYLLAPVAVAPSGLVGTSGHTGERAPGAYTPTKGTAVRLLDARAAPAESSYVTYSVEVNRKLQDFGVSGALGLVDPNLRSLVLLPGPNLVWAWYGLWTDKNGNGVIDTMSDFCGACGSPVGSPPDGSPVRPEEEFVWYGNCHRDGGAFNPKSLQSGYCRRDVEAALGVTTRIHGFFFPGNHHGRCGGYVPGLGAACFLIPADLPARQAMHLACLAAAGVPGCYGAVPVGFHGSDGVAAFDSDDEQYFGDPLLGVQGSVAPDGDFNDRTGDNRLEYRLWLYGVDPPIFLYDQSVLASLVAVAAAGCPPSVASPNRVLLGACRLVDVDHYRTFSPAAEQLLTSTVKPAARAGWLMAREAARPPIAFADGARNHRALDATPTTGPVDDALLDPGWSREPNEPGDAYPAARHGRCADGTATHHGWCNDYAGHGVGPRAFGDVQTFRILTGDPPDPPVPYGGEAPGALPLRPAGAHQRTLGPGTYTFTGTFGRWHDRPQSWLESSLDLGGLGLVTVERTAARDGWVGNIVNTTGTYYYRGYADEDCATDQGSGPKPYGACHPYRDGAAGDPQAMAAGVPAHGEWEGRCDGVVGDVIVVTPSDGIWDVPVFVEGLGEPPTRIADYTGRGAFALPTSCATGVEGPLGRVPTVVLPLGNLHEEVVTRIAVRVGGETVTDVDRYVPWG